MYLNIREWLKILKAQDVDVIYLKEAVTDQVSQKHIPSCKSVDLPFCTRLSAIARASN